MGVGLLVRRLTDGLLTTLGVVVVVVVVDM